MVALVDCDNFFVSCERVFDPGLRSRPVAVLSSNDGCIVARSSEVKAMGVPMGAPLFKYREVCRQNQVVLRSSNFQLYSDMSSRVMAVLKRFTPSLDVYSIDEAFLETPSANTSQWAEEIKAALKREVGIPSSIGIATTKTLAKAAAYLSKQGDGVTSFAGLSEGGIDAHLLGVPLNKVWGIGSRTASRLYPYGIETAYDLKHLPAGVLARHNVTTRRLVMELNGNPDGNRPGCHSKSMISSRSFGQSVSSYADLDQALSSHAARIGEKLRREGLSAQTVNIFISTGVNGRFFKSHCRLPVMTDDTRLLTTVSAKLLAEVYRGHLSYKKAGVMVQDLCPSVQLALDSNPDVLAGADKLNGLTDSINRKWGHGTLKLAAEGLGGKWHPKHLSCSPRYTTMWSELKKVG